MPPRVYLDHHATTPLCPEAREALRAYAEGAHGNPSSVHGAGRRARHLLERARATVAQGLGASAREVVFTSGGTEGAHFIVRAVGGALGPSRVCCDPGAHPCLVAASELLAGEFQVPFFWLPVHDGGALDLEALPGLLRPGALVAASLVQHETGRLLRWRALRDACHDAKCAWVCDAAQALGKTPLDVGVLGARAASVSGHKVGGPTGIGAVWVSGDAKVRQLVTGGSQERGLRAGTPNMYGIVGLGAAMSVLNLRLGAMEGVGRLRAVVEEGLLVCEGVTSSVADLERVATVAHVAVEGVAGEELVAALDLEGYEVSSGAACSSGRAEPSATLLRLFPSAPWRASGALRVSLGPETTEDEVRGLVEVFPRVLARVRGQGYRSTTRM
ncbi:MAG: aminotransferase class V-fold PLP-dependent enzyme [Deltaproteobacteria bacterium]|nr:aminotransferase class V-fold PLP-dependent enzyme [Deltaproteobacteria bacterium]